jgi:K+/H+ antiporter YhaU regulatory subunit KhtT
LIDHRQFGGERQNLSANRRSIVAIERAGANIINPGPDEEIQADDPVLLPGWREQLDAARQQLLGQG